MNSATVPGASARKAPAMSLAPWDDNGAGVNEFDFRYNTRDLDDFTRASLAIKGAEGKRLTYQQPTR